MKKLLLLPLLLSMTLTAVAGDEVDKSDDKPDVVVRTGTCGSIAASTEKNCKSVGINVKTGEIVMSVDADGKDVWTEGSAVVVGQLATQGALDATNKRITDNANTIYQEGVLRYESDGILLDGIETARGESIQGDEYLTSNLNSEIAARILGDKAAGERIDTNADSIVAVKSDVLVNAGAITELTKAISEIPSGADGTNGDKGDTGETGSQGIQGEQGEQGLVGATGDKGAKGKDGDLGEKGYKGDVGVDGAKGDTGLRGEKGEAGLDLSVEVETNEDGISVNAGEIVAVKSAALSLNNDVALIKTDVATNAGLITSNTQDISDNTALINKADQASEERDATLLTGQKANAASINVNAQGIASNTNLIADVDQASKDRDDLLSKQLTDEEAARIAGDLASVERDIVISADVAVNKAGVATNAAGIASTNAELSTVSGKVDANKFAHDNLEVRVKQTDVRLVETDVRVYANAQGISANSSSIDGLRDYSRDNRVAIAGNSSRIDWNSVSIGNLQHDINRLDGQIAAQVAASASIMPSNWDGRFAVTVGVGSYRGQTGLALGIMHDNGDWAVKAQVTGTDADNWSDLAVGASVGFAF